MQRRQSERIPLNLPAKLFLGGKPYDGTIVNVSEDGIGSAVTSVVEASAEFIPISNIELQFQDPSGTAIDLVCELAWFSRNEINLQEITIGMKIIDPPLMYKAFIKKLYDANLKERSKEHLIADLLESRRKIADLQTRIAELSREDKGMLKREDAYHYPETDLTCYIDEQTARDFGS